jgi:formylglycine-generating enzyme required for sulfatase activity
VSDFETLREELLRGEHAEVRHWFAHHSRVAVRAVGSSPTEYRVTYTLNAPVGRASECLRFADRHEARIVLPDDFPISAPLVDMMTPTYHPNIAIRGRVCTGDARFAEFRVGGIIAALGDYLQYRAYSLDPAYRDEVAEWVRAEQHAGRSIGPFDEVQFVRPERPRRTVTFLGPPERPADDPELPWKTAAAPARVLARRYRLVRLLGSGGMGEVHQAEDLKLGRVVAIKLLPADSRTAGAHHRFLAEAKAAARVSHPHVVTVHDMEADGDQLYMVLELLAGGSWQDEVDRRGPVPWPEATRAIYHAALGLAAVHSAGLVHRDLKPANLLHNRNGHTKVADFGLARIRDALAELTAPGVAAGTPHYMSPELWTGAKDDPRGDVYSLTATYYALLAGRPPFHGCNPYALRSFHLSEPFPPAGELPPGVQAAIHNGSAKVAGRRYPTAAAFAEALAALLAPTPVAPIPPTAGGPSAPHPPDELPRLDSGEQARRHQLHWQGRLGTPEVWTNRCGMTFRLIPPGRAVLGARLGDRDAGGTERRAYEYTLAEGVAPFWLATFPVTWAVIEQFLADTSPGFAAVRAQIGKRSGWSPGVDARLPATCLDLREAEQVCRWLSSDEHTYRLPTEDEWEYAARAGAQGRFWWEPTFPPTDPIPATPPPAHYGAGHPSPADPGRANAWGLVDVLGNVAEWTYPAAPDPGNGIVRGGSFIHAQLKDLRLSQSRPRRADAREAWLGFRVIREVGRPVGGGHPR